MKVNRSFVTSENDSKIKWGDNGATTFAVVNKDTPNKFGEYPGYRIVPSMFSRYH
jgi:primary-amine oxidase